jgi:hypothetical protein
MSKGIAEHLGRVALVSQGWADDRVLPPSLRHMSLHLNRLATTLLKSRHPFPAAVKDVEALFCLICQRIKAKSEACQTRFQSLDQCPILKDVVQPVPWGKL